MEKLERYLDQACRGVGGPRSLRIHVRQELREHLIDAAAAHQAAGLSEEEAMTRAIEDFGGPEEVRSELAATHGHRLTAVIVDKALAWKERTMKATWLWTTWAHVALILVIALEILFVALAMMYILPKVQEFTSHVDTDGQGLDARLPWASSFLNFMNSVSRGGLLLVLAVAAAWWLFEWRLRSENKTIIRLSILGTAAVALMAVVLLTGMVTMIPLAVAAPMLEAQLPERVVPEQLARVETAAAAVEPALEKKDWPAVREQTSAAAAAMARLANLGGAAYVLTTSAEPVKVDATRTLVEWANQSLREARNAAWDQDAERVTAALEKFRKEFAQLQPAKKSQK